MMAFCIIAKGIEGVDPNSIAKKISEIVNPLYAAIIGYDDVSNRDTKSVLSYLKTEFGSSNVKIEEDLVDPFDTEWFKETSSRLTPGSNLKFYRKQNRMTQQELAERLGTTKQAVCAMEHDSRPISKRTAKILAGLFATSPARFI